MKHNPHPVGILALLVAALIAVSSGCSPLSRPAYRYKEFDEQSAKLMSSSPGERHIAERQLRQEPQIIFEAADSDNSERRLKAIRLLSYLHPPGTLQFLLRLTYAPRSTDKVAAWDALHDYVLTESDPVARDLVLSRAERQIQAGEIPLAGEVLQALGDPRAVPTLKAAQARSTDKDERMYLAELISSLERNNKKRAR